MSSRDYPMTDKKQQKFQQIKKQNFELRKVCNRQRRHNKELTAMIINAKHAAEQGDIVRCFAIISAPIKHPPSEVTKCEHHHTQRHCTICRDCGEVVRDYW